MNNQRPLIEFRHVSKKYGSTEVLIDLNLEIQKGEFVVILGESGVGKTTILRLINRLILPDEGEIFLRSKPLASYDPIKLRRGLGYVIQQTGLFPHLTVAENICYVLSLNKRPVAEQAARARELIQLIGLDESYLDRMPDELSGGEAQRVGVARGLANDPDILLMDEPFAAVDDINRRNLQRQLKEIQKGLEKTILFVTHDIREAFYLADRVAIFHQGRLVRFDSPQAIADQPGSGYVKDFIGSNAYLALLDEQDIRQAYETKREQGVSLL